VKTFRFLDLVSDSSFSAAELQEAFGVAVNGTRKSLRFTITKKPFVTVPVAKSEPDAKLDAPILLKPTLLADMSVSVAPTPVAGMSSVPLANPNATLLVIACELTGLTPRKNGKPEHFLDVMVEARKIQAIWGEGACLIMFNKTPDEVCHRINREGSQISMVHFVGHGDLPDGNRYNLAFSDAQGLPVTSEQTGSLSLLQFYRAIIHKKKRKLELVFLNGCQVPPHTHTLYIHS
jgi:hypothetical protein